MTSVTCTNAYALAQIQYKYFTIADFFCFRTFDNCLDCFLHKVLVYRYFDSDLLKQVHFEFNAPVAFFVSMLFAAAQGVRYGNLANSGLIQGFFNILQFVRLNVRYYKLRFRISN